MLCKGEGRFISGVSQAGFDKISAYIVRGLYKQFVL